MCVCVICVCVCVCVCDHVNVWRRSRDALLKADRCVSQSEVMFLAHDE